MLGNLAIAIGITLLGGLGAIHEPNTPTTTEKPTSKLVTLDETYLNKEKTLLFVAKNIENNGEGAFYDTNIAPPFSYEMGSGFYNAIFADIVLQRERTIEYARLGFVADYYETTNDLGTFREYYLSYVYIQTSDGNQSAIYVCSNTTNEFNAQNAIFTVTKITYYTDRIATFRLINDLFDVYENENDMTDTTMYELITPQNVYTYLNGFYAFMPKETDKEDLNLTCDTRQIMSIVSGKKVNAQSPNDILKTYMEVSDTYTLSIYNDLLCLRETITSNNTYNVTYLMNCIYIGNGRVNTSDLQDINLYKVVNPKLLDKRFINTTIVLNGQMNPYQKWGYNIKTDLFIPQDTTIQQNGEFNYYWFEGVATINDYIVKNIKNHYANAYGAYYWLNGNTSSTANHLRFLLENYMYFIHSYGEWDKRINGRTQGQTVIGTGTDSNRPLVSTVAYAQTEDYSALTYATENKTSQIYIAIIENGYDLETIQLQFENYYIINDTITGDSVFDLIAKGFKSWQVLFNLQVGTLSLGVLFFAPLLIGFMIWLIHLVKRG